jgi:hypothetical protein
MWLPHIVCTQKRRSIVATATLHPRGIGVASMQHRRIIAWNRRIILAISFQHRRASSAA